MCHALQWVSWRGGRWSVVAVAAIGLAAAAGVGAKADGKPGLAAGEAAKTYAVRGTVRDVQPGGTSVVVAHDAVAGYMDAMTMPFRAQTPRELAGLRAGDRITFQLHVTSTDSWIDQVSLTGTAPAERARSSPPTPAPVPSPPHHHPLLDCKFTNELGQAVSLGEFKGQALAITFFFTRCPIPNYCPRLSRNFQEASQRLAAMPNAPTNWHFLSVSFDTAFDTPPVLKAYGERYQYDPRHWSFLTGAPDKVAELASQSDVKFDREAGLFSHNFRTLIIDAAGKLQMAFPVGGDLSEAIVEEMVRAANAGK